MHVLLHEQAFRLLAAERQQQAEAHNRVARLVAARRWERRAVQADRRARLARAAIC